MKDSDGENPPDLEQPVMDLKPGEPQPRARWIGPEQCQGLLEPCQEQLLRRGQGEAERKVV